MIAEQMMLMASVFAKTAANESRGRQYKQKAGPEGRAFLNLNAQERLPRTVISAPHFTQRAASVDRGTAAVKCVL